MELDGPVRRTVLVDGLSQQSVSRDLGNLCTGMQFSWRVRGFGEFIGFGDDCVALCAGRSVNS